MIEQEIKIELAVADIEPVLATDKGKAASEFEEEFLDVGEQASFQLALMEGLFQGEEVEDVGILQQALGEVA